MIIIEKAKRILETKELADGLKRYREIMDSLHCTNVSKNKDFQKVYRNFYRMNRFYSEEFAYGYFQIMEHLKTSPVISFEMALERVKHIKGSYEISFSSKMAHTIDPELPVWDKIVTKDHFHINAPYTLHRNRERACCAKYEEYRRRFYVYLSSEEGQALASLFDEAYPNSGISDVKKVDFILWQDR